MSKAEMTVMRSMLGRARGRGAAKSGVHHWWVQRVSSVMLLPLTLWFVWSMAHMAGAPRAAVAAWLHGPVNASLMIATLWMTFWHLEMGVGSVMEDYIRSEPKRLVSMLVLKGTCGILALVGTVAVLKLAVTG